MSDLLLEYTQKINERMCAFVNTRMIFRQLFTHSHIRSFKHCLRL